MVVLESFLASDPSTELAVGELAAAIDGSDIDPNLICVFYDADHDDAPLYDFLRDRFPEAALLGGTSCSGAMSEKGLGGPGSIGMLLIQDPDGDYGSAAVELEGDPADCAERALHAALENADCAGELPELIWIYQAPGQEEAVIEGLRRVVGDRCPIIGGSSADNTVAGGWRQLGPDGAMKNGVVVGVLFSSGGIGYAFQGGYEPTGPSGVVTRIGYAPSGESGIATKVRSRQIVSIDGEPAAEVYNRWVGGSLAEKVDTGGNILTDTTMFPLGIDAGRIEDVTHYLLIHPEQITTDGAISAFASVEEGTRLYSMKGNKNRLVERAGRVASAAVGSLGDNDRLAGGLIVYCAGCMLAVDDQMDRVSVAVAESLDGRPFVGCFTFGEQGLVLDRNAHGNLMISAIVFGK